MSNKPLPRPVRYHFDDGDYAPAVLVAENRVIINMTAPAAAKYIGAENWFAANYVEYWQGLVPDCCDQGTDPGNWSEVL